MNLEERIRRRQRPTDEATLVTEWEPLSPVAHVEEPVNRAMVIERVLDHFDPLFERRTPPNLYLHGPAGTGKSAVVTALCQHLDRYPISSRPVIYTTTRVAEESPVVVYLDARRITSEFEWYHSLLDELVEESVPERGVGTDRLETRLRTLLRDRTTKFVVAIDHFDEPTVEVERFVERLDSLPDNLCWLAVGRTPPGATPVAELTADAIEFDPYRQQVLTDVVMARASLGLSENVLDHDLAREIAERADGNAHDALTALSLATGRAVDAGRTTITDTDIYTAFEDIPDDGVALGRVLSLPENRQAVLRELVDIPPDERRSVASATRAIDPELSLSPGTIKRFVYELAEAGVLKRIEAMTNTSQGRRPSRVEYLFPAEAFRRLYDRRQ
ncbi:Cdc6/Cdc18 family protein [Haloarcula pelagica]